MPNKKPRRYPPNQKSHILAARYTDKATGDLVLLYHKIDPTIIVRIPADELNTDWWKRKKKVRS